MILDVYAAPKYPSMKTRILGFFLSIAYGSFGQTLSSGNYGPMQVAFDSTRSLITGYYENYTGHEQQFSCVFYLEGVLDKNHGDITSYLPGYKHILPKLGEISLQSDSTFTLLLQDDHGGCWNVEDFISAPAEFMLEAQTNATQIRFVSTEKAYFHASKTPSSREKSYVIQGDLLYVDVIEGNWAFCNFYGKTKTSGWIDLNVLNDIGKQPKKLPRPDNAFLASVNPDSDEGIESYIQSYFTGGEHEVVLETTSWDTDGVPRVCHTVRAFNGVTIEKYSCEQFPTSTFRFKGYSYKEVLAVMKLLFVDNDYEHWQEDGFGPIEEGAGCYLTIEEKPFEIVVSYGCGC